MKIAKPKVVAVIPCHNTARHITEGQFSFRELPFDDNGFY
jgi:hypothetical protein